MAPQTSYAHQSEGFPFLFSVETFDGGCGMICGVSRSVSEGDVFLLSMAR